MNLVFLPDSNVVVLVAVVCQLKSIELKRKWFEWVENFQNLVKFWSIGYIKLLWYLLVWSIGHCGGDEHNYVRPIWTNLVQWHFSVKSIIVNYLPSLLSDNFNHFLINRTFFIENDFITPNDITMTFPICILSYDLKSVITFGTRTYA